MASTKVYSHSFGGGEVSYEMFGRIDDAKYQSGAALMKNMIATPQGPAENRAGFEYVIGTPNNVPARLIPFSYSNDQTCVIEMSQYGFRFHTDGGTLMAQYRNFINGLTVSITIASPGVITITPDGTHSGVVADGDTIVFGTTGSLPTGITAGTTYYVRDSTGLTFSIAATDGGTAIVTSGTQSGTHSVYGYYKHGECLYQGILTPISYAAYYCESDGYGNALTDTSHFIQIYFYGSFNPSSSTTNPYIVAADYTADELFDIHYVQSNDVMTIVHPNHPVRQLERLSSTRWVLNDVNFQPSINPPSSVSVTPTYGYKALISTCPCASNPLITTVANHTLSTGSGVYLNDFIFYDSSGNANDLSGFYMVTNIPTQSAYPYYVLNELYLSRYDGTVLDTSAYSYMAAGATIQLGTQVYDIDNYYVVTAVDDSNVEQSIKSSAAHVVNNLYVTGSYNTITWSSVSGAGRYNIYKKKEGLYGYIGQTTDLTFVDNDIAPDLGTTPPVYDSIMDSTDNYPGAVGYIEQRRCFAGTNTDTQKFWLSRAGTESDFSYSLPTQDSDRIMAVLASRQNNRIQHVIPLSRLILLTASAEFAPIDASVLTPSTISMKPQSYIGSNNVVPAVVNNSIVFCAANGGHVREMGYQWQASGFVTGDLSIRAAHLFDFNTIVDMCYQKSPRPIVWCVSDSGKLLGLTYVPEEQVGAWHQHVTDGTFESVACVKEGNYDRVYAVIARTVNGESVRYVERMGLRLIDDQKEAFFVDAGLTYNGTSATTISGLAHLVGKTVSILADGAVVPQQVVSNAGTITLPVAASVVTVGLPYDCDLQTLPVSLQVDGYGQGRSKNINKAWMRIYNSGAGIMVGPDADHLVEYKQRTTEAYGVAPALQSKEIMAVTSPSWNQDGQILIRQSNPLPLTVVGLTLEVSIGG